MVDSNSSIELSEEEQRLFAEYQATRPTHSAKKKKTKEKRKNKVFSLIKTPETYATIFAIIPVFIIIFGLAALFTINQITDVDAILALNPQEATEIGIIAESQLGLFETGAWIYDNAILLIVGSCAVFFIIAVIILLVSRLWRATKKRDD